MTKPTLSGDFTSQAAADAVKQARLAVLSDPDGEKPDSRNFGYIPRCPKSSVVK